MSLIGRKPNEVPRGYELTEVCSYLRRSSQELDKAGILMQLKKTYPQGSQNPLYDVDQVEALEINLVRHDGLIAFKVLQSDAPLIHAFEPGYSNELDCTCPECDGIAIGDPRTHKEERAAQVQTNSWPRLLWCFACGFVEVNYETAGEESRHRLLGAALPEKD